MISVGCPGGQSQSAGQTFADPAEIAQATELATVQLNAHTKPWVRGRPPAPPRPRRRRFTYLL
jgi:hypothetical protein